MAITKVSQLVQLNNAISIQSLTNRSFNTFGNGNILSVNDLIEVSFKRYTANGGTFNTNYYSVAATIDDLQYAIGGKLYQTTPALYQKGAMPALLMYNPKFKLHYKTGDKIFYIDDSDNIRVIKRTAKRATHDVEITPNKNNIAEIDVVNTEDNYWQYATSPFNKYILPIFSSIRTVSKLDNPGYWVEAKPYQLVNANTYVGAYDILTSNYYMATHITSNNGNTGGDVIEIPVSSQTISSVILNSPLSSTYTKNTNLASVAPKVSATYNTLYDRYILKFETNSIDEITSTLQNIGSTVFSDSISSINFPFFTIATVKKGTPNEAHYIGLPYSGNNISLNTTTKLIANNSVNTGNAYKAINSHLYYFLGNSLNEVPNNLSVDLINSIETVNIKEDRLESDTLDIIRPAYDSEGLIDKSKQIKTLINLQYESPLTVEDKILKLSIGDSLTTSAQLLQYNRDSRVSSTIANIGNELVELQFSNSITLGYKANSTAINFILTDGNTKYAGQWDAVGITRLSALATTDSSEIYTLSAYKREGAYGTTYAVTILPSDEAELTGQELPSIFNNKATIYTLPNIPKANSYNVIKEFYNTYTDQINQVVITENLKKYVNETITIEINNVKKLITDANDALYKTLYGPIK